MALTKPPGRAELLPRYLYFSSLLKGRRVLEVGSVAATEGFSAHFLAKYSLEVTAVDDAADAVAKAQKTLGRPELDFRAGPLSKLKGKLFDVIFASEVTDAAMVDELSKLVARKGHLIVAFRNPNGASLSGRPSGGFSKLPGQVINALSQKFEATAVLSQLALLGYEITAEGAQELNVDGSLVDDAQPAYQLVIAGATLPPLNNTTLFRLSAEDVDLGADDARVKALGAGLHQLRVEMVDRQAELHTLQHEKLGLEEAVSTDVHQRLKGVPAAAPVVDQALLENALGQLKRAAEELKSAAATAAQLKGSLDKENKARVAAEQELEKVRAEQTVLEKQVTEKLEALRVAAVTERQAREKRFDEELALSESRFKVQFDGEREALQKRLSEAEALVNKYNTAGRELSKKHQESEAALSKAKNRVVELEEELALTRSLESNAVAAEQAQVTELRAKLSELEGKFASFAQREAELLALVEAEKQNSAHIDRSFAGVMRELREALDQKEALEKQVANEKLERARLERMRKA